MPENDRKLTMVELDRIPASVYHRAADSGLHLVLDDLRSRHNVGSLFRSADAFGVERIHLCGFTPLPPHREIEKTALGATSSVPWEHGVSTLGTVRDLQEQGFFVVAVEQTLQARPLGGTDLPSDRKLALVLGNEVHGVADEVIAACDLCLYLPQSGSKHSLNVSVCGGVVLWQLSQDRRPARS